MQLVDYVMRHAKRGACLCGRCVDAGPEPEKRQPHGINVGFFQVARVHAEGEAAPTKEEFLRLTSQHRGEFVEAVDPNDGKVHDYIELGAWIGDQGLAMMYMGLGALLGAFDLAVIPDRGPICGKIPEPLKALFSQVGWLAQDGGHGASPASAT